MVTSVPASVSIIKCLSHNTGELTRCSFNSLKAIWPASIVGLGAILLQEHHDRKLHTVAYAS